ADVRGHFQEAWELICVDEFQDTSPAQLRWLELVAGGHRNVTAVGDVAQAVFGFRGSDPAVAHCFEREFGARVMALESNYRSLGRIVRLANAVLAEAGERRLRSHAVRGLGGEAAITALPDERTEARAIAAGCRDWLDDGVPAE